MLFFNFLYFVAIPINCDSYETKHSPLTTHSSLIPTPTSTYNSIPTLFPTSTFTYKSIPTLFPTSTSVPSNKPSPQTNPSNLINSIATFYFRVGDDVPGCPTVQTFNDGIAYGPCNGTSGVKYNSNSKYWAAIGHDGSRCGESIEVFHEDNMVTLQIMDNCPACQIDNHVDMSLDALIELTGSKEKACAISTTQPRISWRFAN